MDKESLARFECKYMIADEPHPVLGTPCWLWIGAMQAQGYGYFYTHKEAGRWRSRGAHIVMWEHVNGPVPDGLELDHLCRVRRCVRDDHLEAVTHAVNVQRGEAGLHNPVKTHCPSGHPYTEDTYVVTSHPKGHFRRCNVCHAARAKIAKAKKKALRSLC